jgi:hypothetical protein
MNREIWARVDRQWKEEVLRADFPQLTAGMGGAWRDDHPDNIQAHIDGATKKKDRREWSDDCYSIATWVCKRCFFPFFRTEHSAFRCPEQREVE